jgi:adenine-specific DNA-methyltransferase
MIKLKPSEIICLDEGFNGNDQLKINSTQKIKFSNQNEASQIIFRVF